MISGSGMVPAAVFLMAAATMANQAVASVPIPLHRTEPSFREFISMLRESARRKNATPIHAVLAPDYYIARDFGGMFDPSAPPVRNFSASFEFDNARLRPEYKDHGWNEFRRALSGNHFEKKSDGQLCAPHSALERKPFPPSQLCFRKDNDGAWRIAGHINGGD